MFGPHSKPIPIVQVGFKANFNLFRPFWSVSTADRYDPILAESAWFWPNRPNLVQIRAKLT